MPPTSPPVRVRGLRELQRAFARTEKAAQKQTRATFVEVAEPVRRDAEGYARSRVARIGTRWPQMRVGVTTKSVYVAPKQRGRASRRNAALRRPNLAALLMTRSMEPALEENAPLIYDRVDRALDQLATQFDRY